MIDYAIEYNAIKIFKYLVMNNTQFTIQSILYILIQFVVEIMKLSLFNAIGGCNIEIVKYALDNYDYGYLESENIDSKKDETILDIIRNVYYSINFEFFENFLLPFLFKKSSFC